MHAYLCSFQESIGAYLCSFQESIGTYLCSFQESICAYMCSFQESMGAYMCSFQESIGAMPWGNTCRSGNREDSRQRHANIRRNKVFSLKPGAATRYYLTSEYQNKFLTQLRVVMTSRLIITCPCPGKMRLMCSYWFS